MRYLIVATHCVLADAFKETAAMIAGEQAASVIKTFHMTEGMDPGEYLEMVAEFISDKNEDDEYLILADLYGASPCNTSIMGFRGKNYRVVTGLNLGILLEALFAIQGDGSLDDIADQLVATGTAGVQKVYIAG